MQPAGVIVRAIDTNILARYLLEDDPHQSPIAVGIMATDVFIPVTVLLELGWLLMSRYRQSRLDTAAALRDIIDLPSVTVADAARIRWAIVRFAEGADIADMIHLTCSIPAGSFATFDSDIYHAAGEDTPVKIETLR